MISVIIPIHNTPIEFIEECFLSMDNQTFKDFEVLIINDGSDWETTKYIRENSRSNYRIFELEKSGISNALNFGIQISSNDILCRMDADDIMMSNRLELQYKFLDENKDVDVLGGQISIFGDQTGESKHPSIIDSDIIAKSDWFMNHPSVMYRKSSIIGIGGYNSSFDGTEDYELWCRGLVAGLKFRNLNEIVLRHRKHKGCSTVKNNLTEIINKNNTIRNYYLSKIKNKI